MIKTATAYFPASIPAVTGNTPAERKRTRAAFETAAAEIISTSATVIFTQTKSTTGEYIIATPSPRGPGYIQLTYFDERGPYTETTHDDAADAAVSLPDDSRPAAAVRY